MDRDPLACAIESIGETVVQATQGMMEVRELTTLVPVNPRRPEEWTQKADVGNVATGLLVPLPIGLDDPVDTFCEVRRRVEEKKADPAAGATPALAELLAVLGRQLVTWMNEVTFGVVDFIVTNVPGILATRYLAGTEILAAYRSHPSRSRVLRASRSTATGIASSSASTPTRR